MKKQFFERTLRLFEKFGQFCDSLAQEFGFHSLSAVFQESFLLNGKYIGIYITSLLGSISLAIWEYVAEGKGSLHNYIELNIYKPSKAVLWLFIIVIVDILLGISKARATALINVPEKTPELADGNKFLRSIVKFILQIFFIMFLTNLSTLYPVMSSSLVIITHGIMLAFIIATFLSAWNSGYLLGFIQKEVHEFVVSVLDLRKILSIFKPTLPKKYENQEATGDDSPTKGTTGRTAGGKSPRKGKGRNPGSSTSV